MAYKFQLGSARLSGSTVFEESLETLKSFGAQSLSASGDVDAGGDLTAATITMAGFSVDADGDLTAKSLVIPDDATIGAVGDTDMITLDAGNDVTFASDLNIVMGDGKLVLNATAVTSTAAELNLLDGVSGLVKADFTKLAAVDATAAEINYLDNDDLESADFVKLAALTATAAEINYLDNDDLESADFVKLAAVTSTAAELNKLDGAGADVTAAKLTTLSALSNTEIAFVDGALDSGVASKAVIFDSDKDINGVRKLEASSELEAPKVKASTRLQTVSGGSIKAFLSSSGEISGSGNFSAAGDATVQGQLQLGGLFKMPSNTDTHIFVADGTSFRGVALSGDASISNTGALTIASDAVEQSMIADDAVGADQLAASAVVNGSVVDGALKADKLDLDGSTDIGADLADADLLIVDDGAGGTNRVAALSRMKKYVYSAISGDATVTDSGVLSITANAVAARADGESLTEGYNIFADLTSDATVTLPSSAGSNVGDVIIVKAKGLTSAKIIIDSQASAQKIDGENSVQIESPFGAVSMVYVAADDWRIV